MVIFVEYFLHYHNIIRSICSQMNTLQVNETWRVNGTRYSENISRGASVYTANASYLGSCDQNLCLSHIEYYKVWDSETGPFILNKAWVPRRAPTESTACRVSLAQVTGPDDPETHTLPLVYAPLERDKHLCVFYHSFIKYLLKFDNP